MNEDMLITTVMETQDRVDKLEMAMFTMAEKERLFNTLDFLAGKYTKLDQEAAFTSLRLTRISDEIQTIKGSLDMLRNDVVMLKTDVSTVKTDLALLKTDVVKVKEKLEIA